ncbi:receptor-like serine/threonine-protein kinase sd1-8 [Quercus suber]|uniref:Receptor-like serine/threonine-protein kinase sd1-8 n=1 Tax=Quercus suber TaxID=58331 RepID=A0AAW0JDS6_QUESU
MNGAQEEENNGRPKWPLLVIILTTTATIGLLLCLLAYELWKDGKGMEFMDPALDDTTSSCKLIRCMQIALLCVQESAIDRPSMLEVSSMLKNETIVVTNPKKPAFSMKRDEGDEKDSRLKALQLEICLINSIGGLKSIRLPRRFQEAEADELV